MRLKLKASTYIGFILIITIIFLLRYFFNPNENSASNNELFLGITVSSQNDERSMFDVINKYLFSSEDGSEYLPAVKASTNNEIRKLPDFTEYVDVKEKKEAFFSTLYPVIAEENEHILNVRKAVIRLQEKTAQNLTSDEIDWLSALGTHYKVSAQSNYADFFDELLIKVDLIPPSLALTQAAIESGWGSSRFSKQGNNLFGQWCFKKGCGMVPSSRDSGKGHEVAKFATVNHAVRAYLRNLNTNNAYKKLRLLRSELRDNDEYPSGKALAKSLNRYSEEGPLYVSKVTKFINQNKLQRFNQHFEESLIAAESF